MGAEQDILHNRVGVLEHIRNVNLASLHFPLLLPHDEIGWHLAVRYQGDATRHNKTEFYVVILTHTDSASGPLGTQCCIVLQYYFCAPFPH
jgi:hypothetical protein